MKQIQGLEEYIASKHYREALGLPEEIIETYTFLARGEYNVNYRFTHPLTGQELVLRVNIASQMHLEHQIEYEFQALQLLEVSGRTPKPIYVDGSKRILPQGVLVMEYLEGVSLHYETELIQAAQVLADIHSVDIENHPHQLLHPENPLEAILEECEQMIQIYYDSELAPKETKSYIKMLMELGWKRVQTTNQNTSYQCCINTELNSTNFIVSKEKSYLVDWEKPLKGDPAQDLGHFLAPTTTFWKTDKILTNDEIEGFLKAYEVAVEERFDTQGLRERVYTFIPITCLRGITWCAMAWVQYQDEDKLIRNESTWKKLNQYVDSHFLESIYESYLKNK